MRQQTNTLRGDLSLFEHVPELEAAAATDTQLHAAICWDMYGLPDGTRNPTHASGGAHLLMEPDDASVNSAFGSLVEPLLCEDEQWLLQIPRRTATLHAVDARLYCSPEGGAAIVLPSGAFGGLFVANELFHALLHTGEITDELRQLVSENLADVLAHWVLSVDVAELGLSKDQADSLGLYLEVKRWQYPMPDRQFIWATTVSQQLFLLLHEFGHLISLGPGAAKTNTTDQVRTLSFHGAEDELQADAWAISHIDQDIRGISGAGSEHTEQSLYLLLGILHFLSSNGRIDVDSNLVAQRWLQVARAVNPDFGDRYTLDMSVRLLSEFEGFYLGRHQPHS